MIGVSLPEFPAASYASGEDREGVCEERASLEVFSALEFSSLLYRYFPSGISAVCLTFGKCLKMSDLRGYFLGPVAQCNKTHHFQGCYSCSFSENVTLSHTFGDEV
jgi:hypothetical protein